MGALGRFFLLGSATAVLGLAWVLYPLSRSPTEVPWSSRYISWGFYFFSPRAYGFCSFLSLLTGYSQYDISRELLSFIGREAHFPTVTTRELNISGVHVRLYRPADAPVSQKLPVIVYFHGGGFVTCSIDSHHPMCLKICDISEMAVVSVDYRMAPEHVWPAAFDDCFSVVAALSDNKQYSEELGIDSNAISIAGDSAGGGLTAAVALKWRTTGRHNLRSQVLIYPFLQLLTFDLPSYITEERGVGFLNKDMLLFFASTYIWGHTELAKELESKSSILLPPETWQLIVRRLKGEDVDINIPPADMFPYAQNLLSEASSPLLAKNVSGVAPALVIVAGHDPLCSDGELFAQRLEAAGVEVILKKYPHELHGFHAGVEEPDRSFINSLGHNKNADEMTEEMSSFIRSHSH